MFYNTTRTRLFLLLGLFSCIPGSEAANEQPDITRIDGLYADDFTVNDHTSEVHPDSTLENQDDKIQQDNDSEQIFRNTAKKQGRRKIPHGCNTEFDEKLSGNSFVPTSFTGLFRKRSVNGVLARLGDESRSLMASIAAWSRKGLGKAANGVGMLVEASRPLTAPIAKCCRKGLDKAANGVWMLVEASRPLTAPIAKCCRKGLDKAVNGVGRLVEVSRPLTASIAEWSRKGLWNAVEVLEWVGEGSISLAGAVANDVARKASVAKKKLAKALTPSALGRTAVNGCNMACSLLVKLGRPAVNMARSLLANEYVQFMVGCFVLVYPYITAKYPYITAKPPLSSNGALHRALQACYGAFNEPKAGFFAERSSVAVAIWGIRVFCEHASDFCGVLCRGFIADMEKIWRGGIKGIWSGVVNGILSGGIIGIISDVAKFLALVNTVKVIMGRVVSIPVVSGPVAVVRGVMSFVVRPIRETGAWFLWVCSLPLRPFFYVASLFQPAS
ncbi:MAG: hypothetical protein LBF72_02425 [Holosporales bacterium]|jgi:hypothetical protein|nr:hypothetical protein [Holosporales bacterium]